MLKYAEFDDRYAETKYGMIHYKFHEGESESLFLIHGLAASTMSWARFVEHLPESYRICMVDLLGHGESEAPRISYSVGMQCEIVNAIIKKEGMKGIFMMGHSYGGWIAASYAGTNKNLSGVILEDAGGLRNFFDEVRGTEKREAYKKDILRKAMALNAKEYVIQSIFEDEFTSSELTEEELSGIKIPTLILWGELDDVINKRFADIFKEEINGSMLRIISGSKHTPHYTNAKEVAELVVRFINGDAVLNE